MGLIFVSWKFSWRRQNREKGENYRHAKISTFTLYSTHRRLEKSRIVVWRKVLNDNYSDSFKEWVSFFLGSWGMNRSAGQTNRVNREAVLGQFVCSALRFIPHEPRKKDAHSLYLQCFQQRLFLKFSEKGYKFKIPTVTGT